VQNIPFPRSAILTVIHSFPSNKLELDVSAPKLWLGFESTDMMDVDNSMSEVTPVDSDGAIDDDEVAMVDVVVPECDGAICCVSSEGPGGFEGRGLVLSNPCESIDIFDNRSPVSSVSSSPLPPPTSFVPPPLSFTSLLVSLPVPATAAPALPADPGLLPSPSILLIPNASLSNIGLDPKDEDGEGSGWELCIDMDSDRGVWFPPRPFEGGTPTSLVGGEAGLEAAIAISDCIMDSTSSMQMRTFSGLRSMSRVKKKVGRHVSNLRLFTCMNDTTTSMHVIQAQQDLFGNLPNQRHRDSLVLMSLDQPEQILPEDFEDHADVNTIWAFMSKVVQEGDDV